VPYGEGSGRSRAGACLILELISAKTLLDERGQDVIEYALVVALIALAATAGLSTVAASIGSAFSKVGHALSTYTS
jgi:pilus assembly protein Flp/PilA